MSQLKVEYREQKFKVRSYGKKVKTKVRSDKTEKDGWMASLGPWSGHGETRLAALESLRRLTSDVRTLASDEAAP